MTVFWRVICAIILITHTTIGQTGTQGMATAGFGISVGLSHEIITYLSSAEFQETAGSYLADNTTDSDQTTAATPASLALVAHPTHAEAGAYVTLTWNSDPSQSCVASGDWQGYKPANGTQIIGPVHADQRYLLSCSGGAQSTVTGLAQGTLAEANVTVNNQTGVSVELTASDVSVGRDTSVELTWRARNASNCVAGGDWHGARATSGTFATQPLQQTGTFQITCFDGTQNAFSQSAMEMVTVQVRDSILSWRAPTQQENGAPLQTIAGYRIYWGTNPQQYSDNVLVPADTTEWWADLLPGTYYFAMSTVDGQGLESDLSPELAVEVD